MTAKLRQFDAGYAWGVLTRRNRGGSWADHIGAVDHVYGPSQERVWVRTLCGMIGSMSSRAHTDAIDPAWLDRYGTCGNCTRIARKRLDAT